MGFVDVFIKRPILASVCSLVLILAGAIYFVVNYIIGAGFLALERRLSPHLRPRPS